MSSLRPQVKSVYTQHARPSRGYHDHLTVFTFGPEEGTEDERLAYLSSYRLEKLFPGSMWCGPPKKAGPDTYTINHGYDSGD